MGRISARPTTVPDISYWGDSQPITLETAQNSPTDLLRQLTRRRVNRHGVGGETAQATQARMLAVPQEFNNTVIIHTGHNNGAHPPDFDQDRIDIETAIAAMVAALPHNRYLILTLLNGPYVSAQAPYPYLVNAFNKRAQCNQELKVAYGQDRVIDVLDAFVHFDPQDTAAIAGGYMPWALRQGYYDYSHPNSTGTMLEAQLIYQRLQYMGF